MLAFLNGYKTYIVAFVLAVLSALHSLGKIDDSTFQTFLGVLGSLGLTTLRHGIATTAAQTQAVTIQAAIQSSAPTSGSVPRPL